MCIYLSTDISIYVCLCIYVYGGRVREAKCRPLRLRRQGDLHGQVADYSSICVSIYLQIYLYLYVCVYMCMEGECERRSVTAYDYAVKATSMAR